MTYTYMARFEPDEDGGFLVTFPDVPEAITHGADKADARSSAADALGMALRGYLVRNAPLPVATAKGKDLVAIHPDAHDTLKLGVIEAFLAAGISKSELARRMGKAETEAYRVLDPDHPTKLAVLESVLTLLGRRVTVTIQAAA